MNGECEGNCGKALHGEHYWTVTSSDGADDLDFCSLYCMDSWVHSYI